MPPAPDLERLLQAAQNGDGEAELIIYEKLFERFHPLVTRELRNYSVLAKEIDLTDFGQQICRNAIAEIKTAYPLTIPNWSLLKVMHFFNNLKWDFIANELTDQAKKGNRNAENFLFDIIRTKLFERISGKNYQQWKART